MAKFHAKNTFFTVDDSGGTARSFHPNGGTVGWNESGANPETTSFGDPAIQRSASGLWDLKCDIDGFGDFSTNANLSTLQTLKGVATAVVFGPGGSTSGCPKWSACVLCTDWVVGAPVKNVITLKAAFELRSGSVTYTTF